MVFTKHPDNPVLDVGAAGTWDDRHVYQPKLLYRNHKWYLYYAGHGGVHWRIGLATSQDGITWTKDPDNPVLDVGAAGSWDYAQLLSPRPIYRNNKWYMYYTGRDGTNYRIGLATSQDGITWTKHPGNPVLDVGADGAWDDSHVYQPEPIYRNNKWYMYYAGYDGNYWRIGLATSQDGITWTKHPGNPILDVGAGGTWDYRYVNAPAVTYRNNKWHMYYAGHDGAYYHIGLATSQDGITWTKYPGNPVVSRGAGGTWDDAHANNSMALYRNNKWCLYYVGFDGTNYRIGLVTSPSGV